MARRRFSGELPQVPGDHGEEDEGQGHVAPQSPGKRSAGPGGKNNTRFDSGRKDHFGTLTDHFLEQLQG